MKVAVFGSWSDREGDQEWYFDGTRDVFNDACIRIGRALAENGHTLIVESENPKVADPYVVKGYYEHSPSSSPAKLKIELAWPRGTERPFNDMTQARPELFIHHGLPAPVSERQRWSNSHLVSLKYADAILTIGGKQGTYLAGSAAIVAHKPLIPIACFGGASTRLLKDLSAEHGNNLDADYKILNNPWSSHVLHNVVSLLNGSPSKMLIFVSHVDADEKLAAALVDLIKAAFDISNEAILCTSVPGFTLPSGVHVASRLRSELRKTEFVLGVLTPHSLESQYVLMELGAAWGLGKQAFPLVARGAETFKIPGALGELKWRHLCKSNDCFQMIDDLESYESLAKKRLAGNSAVVNAAVNMLVTEAQLESADV